MGERPSRLRGPTFARVCLGVSAGAAVVLMACDPFAAAEVPAAPPAADGGGASSSGAVDAAIEAAAARDARFDALPVPQCGQAGVFCDDFDDDIPLPRGWSGMEGTPQLSAAAGRDSAGGLRADLVGGGQETQDAYLELHHGAGPDQYLYRLGFDARTIASSGRIQGPRLATTVAGTPSGGGPTAGHVDVAISFEGTRVFVTTFTPGCLQVEPTTCPELSGYEPFEVGMEWHRYLLELDVKPGGAAPAFDYGSIRLTIDGAVRMERVLEFPFSRAATRETRFGNTFAAAEVTGSLDLDSVVVELVDAF